MTRFSNLQTKHLRCHTVVVSDPLDPINGFYAVVNSERFCRAIYDLMLKHCPERIEQQREMYRKVNRKLETLLFEGKDIEGSAQQAASPNGANRAVGAP